MTLASILHIPGNNGICDYVKEVFEESKYCHPLEITRKFANDDSIMMARRVKSVEMRPFQRHMAYVINVPHHELPYGELLIRIFKAFEVPLDDKEGEEQVKTDCYDEIFLSMCQMRRGNGIWWLGSGANRRIDEIEDEDENEEESESEDEETETEEENENAGKLTLAGFEWEEAQVEGGKQEKEAEIDGSGSVEEFFDAEDEGNTTAEDAPTLKL
ncbi:hypothetical protein Dimus_031624 [Dionaea muscipula]